jgi:hypothetical protein
VDQPYEQSQLEFIYHSLGFLYCVLLPLSALVSFILVVVAVARWRGAASVAVLMFAAPMPVYLGLYATVSGLLASYQVIMYTTTQPRPSEMAQGIGMSLVSFWIGMFLSVPGFFVALIGSLVRLILAPTSDSK